MRSVVYPLYPLCIAEKAFAVEGDRMHKGVVFVIEDDDDVRELARELLEFHGWLVLPARDGLEALARMRGFTGRAVVLLDLWLPRMDGWQVMAAMQRDAALRKIPVVVLTAQSGEVKGARQIMRKPFLPEALLSAVSEAHRAA